MIAACPTCSRRNPAGAFFCYFDGAPLSGNNQGPLKAGSAPFPSPFVFAGGLACSNFNQLVMGCQHNWSSARECLADGTFGLFFKGFGRLDLVQAAQGEAKSPDADRGLYNLLVRLPADVLQPPKLAVEPRQISLGLLRPGADAKFKVMLANQGMGLLMGTVTSNCDWLVLGEGKTKQTLFQSPVETHLPVRIDGKKLRAGVKRLEAVLRVESNGGSTDVVVHCEVPVLPFGEGVLAGAKTPRDIAVRAKKFRGEAAALFEKGAVERWYQSNGWSYPVQGPTGSGLGSIQQFFEALGLVSVCQDMRNA